jgi:hypothetical protein
MVCTVLQEYHSTYLGYHTIVSSDDQHTHAKRIDGTTVDDRQTGTTVDLFCTTSKFSAGFTVFHTFHYCT